MSVTVYSLVSMLSSIPLKLFEYVSKNIYPFLGTSALQFSQHRITHLSTWVVDYMFDIFSSVKSATDF